MGDHHRGTGRRSWIGPALALAALAFAGGGLRPACADIPNVIYYAGTGHYYKWVSGSINWTNARSGAEGLGGYLASVTSATEQTWLQANIVPSGQQSWLGGTDETSEGVWAWLSGEPWTYTYWNGGEPNNSGNEDYLMWNTNSTWNDIGPTSNMNGYVVEWNVNPNIPPPPAAATTLDGVLGGANHVLLTWNDNSTNEESFELDRKTTASPYARLANVPPNTTTFDDADTYPGATYTYRLRAVNAGGVSAYTNEVTVPVPLTPTGPVAPSGLAGTPTGSSVALQWTDNSDDETGFEVQRRNAAGVYQFLTTAGPDATQYVNGGLLPDTAYSYRVRGINGSGSSGFTGTTVSTLPTLEVATVAADLKDSPKFGKDSLKLQATFDFLPASDGTFDPVAEGIQVRAGSDAAPLTIGLPPDFDGWKVTATKACWKSSKGTLPKYKIEVFFESRLVRIQVARTEFPTAPSNPMRVGILIGDDAGTQHLDWPLKKAGTFKFR